MGKFRVAVVVISMVGVMLGFRAGMVEAASPPVNFGEKTDHPTGNHPLAVAVDDLNGDAFLDVVTANEFADSVSVLLGDGTGGFGAKTDFPAGNGARSVVVGDLNGDTFLDVVTANFLADSVSVLLGDGSGGLGTNTEYATGDGPTYVFPTAVALGDLNGDTFLDLAVSNFYTDSVSVLLGDGSGTFGSFTEHASGARPEAVAVGDLNADTFLDLVSAGSDSVSVLLGDGSGGFGGKTDFVTGGGPGAVVLADLNDDSFPDIATANSGPDTVSVLLGDGTGSFGPRTDFATGPWPRSLTAADLNGDTFVDLVTPNNDSSTLSVLLGDGAGGFDPKTDFGTGNRPASVAIGELNGDGRLDLVAANYSTDNSASVLLNTTGDTPTAPGAPTIGTATAGNAQAMVTWTAPASNGGSAITGYVVTPYIGYFPLGSTTFNSTATTQTVTGLTNGTTYRFRVRAINAVGTSGYSRDSNPVTPAATVPGAPTIIRNATAGNGEATVSWTAPASDGGSTITGYVVTPYIGYYGLPPQTFSSTATTQVATGLANGTTYRFRVRATNAVGTSGYSKVTNPVTPTV